MQMPDPTLSKYNTTVYWWSVLGGCFPPIKMVSGGAMPDQTLSKYNMALDTIQRHGLSILPLGKWAVMYELYHNSSVLDSDRVQPAMEKLAYIETVCGVQ